MSRRLLLLDIVLLGLVVFGVVRLRRDTQAFSANHQVSRIQPESGKPLLKPVNTGNAPARQDWPEIAAHDPFSFDRNDVAIVATAPAVQQPKKPKPLLYGTIMLGKNLLAMLAPADAQSRFARPVRAGEVFDGWTVVEIREKTVTVQWDEVKETLNIDDPTAQVARDYGKTGGSGAAPAPVVTVGPVAAPVTATPAPASNPFAPQPITTSPTGKRKILVHTPFGDNIIDDPSQ
ncbi:MAG TPA: hypothetical protein VGK48_01525 [Terriglobia bacterium]|jgi:hypothetical protein